MKYEYRVIFLDESQLNHAAREGFRLVSTFIYGQWDEYARKEIKYQQAIMERKIEE